ncbi:kinase-like domain-containing protein [Choanephora cucurbitarum]|nr:kinase-like domain-containing protein [Choanephora cucurbitarum]
MQEERLRQLKELEEQVTDTANWNQRRRVLTVSTSHLSVSEDNSILYPASNTPSPIIKSNNKVDLGEATLEDLEDLIAASAKRLASYRLRNSNHQLPNQKSPSPTARSNIKKKSTGQDELNRWKELLDHRLSSSSLSDQSSPVSANPSSTINSNMADNATIQGERNPSASYQRLRNMFEKDKDRNKSTLLSSKAVQHQQEQEMVPTRTKKASSFSLADLAHTTPSSSSSSSSSHHKSVTSPSYSNWKHGNGIHTTRSTVANAAPKIEPPRISASTTPRVPQLRKATRSYSHQRLAEPSSIPTSTSLEPKRTEPAVTRSETRRTLASLMRERNQKLNMKNNGTHSDDRDKLYEEDDTANDLQAIASQTRRRVKLSITASNTSSLLSQKSASKLNPTAPTATPSDTVIKRKRVKTLPGKLIVQPSIAPLSLPPMKVEPLNIPLVKNSRTVAKTPTRIPLPSSASTSTTNNNNNNNNSTPRIVYRRNNDTTEYNTSSDDDHHQHQKKPSSSYSRGKPISTTGSAVSTKQLRKPKSTLAVSNTPKLRSSKSNKSTDDCSLRKNTLLTPSSSTTTDSSFSSTAVSKSKRKTLALHERLQGLLDVSNSHSKVQEGQSSEVVIRGRGISTSASAPAIHIANGNEDKQPKVMMRVAMTPEAAQKLYQFNLTSYEKQEMMAYEHIYFVGHHAKKRPASPSSSTCNYGYDDERGDYLIQLRDHLDYRYEVLEVMGKGSFGQVLKCFDHRSGQTVAVKMIRNKKRFHAQAMVEVKILEDLMAWDPEDEHNNLRMLGHFMFRNHLCIVSECLSMNLYEFIKSNGFMGFSIGLIRRFATQLLKSLMLLQEHKLIHCDLKPENILLKHPTKSTIKVIDFGSSCLETEKVYTYIQSRFYRSPEVILGMSYSMAIDMWSFGCILAELHTGYPLFPGENEQEQLACIMEIQNVPEPYIIEKSSRRKLFFDSQGNPRIQPNSKGRKRRPGTKSLREVLRSTDELFVDFVGQCLQWDPEQRLKPNDALNHPWIKNHRRK